MTDKITWPGSNGEPEPYSPWLLIRKAVLGNLKNGSPWPSSDDIWVAPHDPDSKPGYPQMGKNNWVFARVWNQGYAGVYGAIVNFYWVGPDTGMRRDQDNLIGSEFIDVPAGSCVEVCCPAPWQPNVIDKGHSYECLVVEAYDPILDPLLFPGDEFHAPEDRHVGQKAWWVPTILPPWGWVTG